MTARDVVAIALWVVVAILVVYTLRHYLFTLNRVFGRHRQPYVDIGIGNWPELAVFVPCHNEERVIGGMLDALLASDYPVERFYVVPINDRSTDGTGRIIDQYAERYPGRVRPFHRTAGKPGKAAALKDATDQCTAPVFMVFDADYLPGPNLLRQLAAPFFDPEVGAVMGRVVPHNLNRSLLTRLLDLERSGGYQVDQQARMNLRLIPQYGGTVGGVRRSALLDAGNWNEDSLAEDTDITYRLVLRGWEVVYQNRSECYEEVPENWPTRIRQIQRWTRGHNQCLKRYGFRLLGFPRHLRFLQVVDGVLLLGVFAVAPVLIVGWALATALFYMGYPVSQGLLILFAVASYSTLGNFAAFFEVATAARLDGSRNRIRLLPFLALGFLVNLLAVSRATVSRKSWLDPGRRGPRWEKTERYRANGGNGS
ncbi:MAG TPA: glycosyltransferase family 2 protein [Gemmatimonadales bacterium]|nr:glycosyltransferase family 2 protein [Gemmatimonadales bacterium]